MFHFHKWSDWSIVERGKIIQNYAQGNVLGSYLIQERFCPKCGQTQLNTQKTIHRVDTHLKPESTKNSPKPDFVKPK